jgi:iron complex outermembrane recepter protein
MQKIFLGNINKRMLLASCAAIVAFGFALPAVAQTSAADKPSVEASADADSSESIVVTGTRLKRAELDAPIPVQVLTSEQIKASGATNVADAVNQIPSLGVPFGRFTRTAGGDELGTTTLNLRNLGSNRTLVLVDGQRQISGVTNATIVDLFTIPTALVERVEVSTGGASVAYGADAVGGVVNFIMKRNYEGLTIDAQYGITKYGDGADRTVTAAYGKNFADGRGNFTISGSYNSSTEINGVDRKFRSDNCVFAPVPGAGVNTSPKQTIKCNAFLQSTDENGILLGAADGTQYTFANNGALAPYVPGNDLGNGFTQGGTGFDFASVVQIQNPNERYLINGGLSFEFSPALRLSAEAKYVRSRSVAPYQPTGTFYVYIDPLNNGNFTLISRDNPFLPNDPRITQLFDDNSDFVLLSKFGTDTGKRDLTTDRETFQARLVAEGRIGIGDFAYRAAYQYGQTKNNFDLTNTYISDRFAWALDATGDVAGVVPGNAPGAPACRATVAAYTANPAGGSPNPAINVCKPLNVFGFGNASAAALAYINTTIRNRESLQQQIASFQVNGSLITLPAGPVAVAAGLEWRQETSRQRPDDFYLNATTFEGSRVNNDGRFGVKEAFGEISIPLLKDKPFFERLTLEGGARISDYSTAGTSTTYRGGVVWAPIRDIRFRAGYSVAVRAPNIGELFLPASQSFSSLEDPCDSININLGPNPTQRQANCLTLVGAGYVDPTRGITKAITVSGNLGLGVETARTLTFGAVLQPGFIPNLTITADYFRIPIRNAITQLDAGDIVTGCVDSYSSINNPLCALVTRSALGNNPAKGITDVKTTFLNVASFVTSGIDFTANYRLNLNTAGSLDFALSGTYLDTLNSSSSVGAAPVDSVGVRGIPKWRANLRTTWSIGDLATTWTARYAGRTYIDNVTPANFSPTGTAPQVFNDINLRLKVEKRFEIFAGANNLFNLQPIGGINNFSVNSGDVIGRFMYAGVTVKY